MNLSPMSGRSTQLLAFLVVVLSAFWVGAQDVPRAVPIKPEPAEPATTRPNAEQNAIDYANLVYSKDYFDMAITEYENYISKFPKGKHLDVARYRLGESLLKEGRADEAEEQYTKNLGMKGSDYIAPAAYRLASLHYNRKDYKMAAPYFGIAEGSPKEAIQLSAGYYRARSLKLTGDVEASIKAYQKIADIEGTNRYREASLLAIGRMQAEAKKHQEALTAFSRLSEVTKTADYKAEALVMSGMLSGKLDKPEDAKKYFSAAMNLEGGDEWKPDAQYQLIKTFTAEGDFKSVIEIYRKGKFAVPEVLQPNMLLMVGKAYREQKRFHSGIEVYLELETKFPTSEEAFEGAYRKLFCFLSAKNPNLPEYVDLFIERYEGRYKGHKYFDMASLMKAESLFNEGAYGAAAIAYGRIDVDRIPENLRASALYKGAWSYSENSSHAQAVRLFSQFIDRYPEDSRMPTALAKRGLSFRSVEDYPSALKDFERIIKDYDGSEPLELAYQQTASIRGQQRNYKGMIEAYSSLLEKFPGTKAKAEAEFWTGWGHFELEEFANAVPPLGASRDTDPDAYYDRATMRIILAHYSLRDVKSVRKEVDNVKEDSQVVVPTQVYSWLGVKLFESGDFPAADNYLTRAATPQAPENTRPIIWKQLGQARMKTDSYKRAIDAFDFYLQSNQPPVNRAKVLLEKGRAQLALKQFDNADRTIEEGLQLQAQGRVNAQLCLAWGDVALARGAVAGDEEKAREQFEAAVRRLVRPRLVFIDDEITPLALDKTIFAHEKLGNKERAEEVRATLREKYPNFKPTETAKVD